MKGNFYNCLEIEWNIHLIHPIFRMEEKAWKAKFPSLSL